MPLAHVAIAFEGCSWTDSKSIPLMVIQSILGSWNRSVGVGDCTGYGISFDSLHFNCQLFAFF
jgi:processing peptidase subunit beta